MNSITDTFKIYNGAEIPCMGLGTWQSKDDTATAAVLSALALGYLTEAEFDRWVRPEEMVGSMSTR